MSLYIYSKAFKWIRKWWDHINKNNNGIDTQIMLHVVVIVTRYQNPCWLICCFEDLYNRWRHQKEQGLTKKRLSAWPTVSYSTKLQYDNITVCICQPNPLNTNLPNYVKSDKASWWLAALVLLVVLSFSSTLMLLIQEECVTKAIKL